MVVGLAIIKSHGNRQTLSESQPPPLNSSENPSSSIDIVSRPLTNFLNYLVVQPNVQATNSFFLPAKDLLPPSKILFAPLISLDAPEGKHFKTTFAVLVVFAENMHGFICDGPTNQISKPTCYQKCSGRINNIYEVVYMVNFLTTGNDRDVDFDISLDQSTGN
jgi:hypothetical protein